MLAMQKPDFKGRARSSPRVSSDLSSTIAIVTTPRSCENVPLRRPLALLYSKSAATSCSHCIDRRSSGLGPQIRGPGVYTFTSIFLGRILIRCGLPQRCSTWQVRRADRSSVQQPSTSPTFVQRSQCTMSSRGDKCITPCLSMAKRSMRCT